MSIKQQSAIIIVEIAKVFSGLMGIFSLGFYIPNWDKTLSEYYKRKTLEKMYHGRKL